MTLKHVHQEEWKINPYQNETLPSPAREERERKGGGGGRKAIIRRQAYFAWTTTQRKDFGPTGATYLTKMMKQLKFTNL